MTRKEAIELLNNRVVTGPEGHKTFGILETLEVLGLIKFDPPAPEYVWWINSETGVCYTFSSGYNPNNYEMDGAVWHKIKNKPNFPLNDLTPSVS